MQTFKLDVAQGKNKSCISKRWIQKKTVQHPAMIKVTQQWAKVPCTSLRCVNAQFASTVERAGFAVPARSIRAQLSVLKVYIS